MSSYNLTDMDHLNEEAVVHKIKKLSSIMNNDESNTISDENAQKLFTLAMEIYVLKLYNNPKLLPFGGDPSVTATDVSIVATKMLKELDLQLFELAMWQGTRGD
jgi:hypothetical protein